jgi:hypothetical protein
VLQKENDKLHGAWEGEKDQYLAENMRISVNLQEELSRNRSQVTSPGKEGLDLERERETWSKERKDLMRDLSKFKEKYEKMKEVN